MAAKYIVLCSLGDSRFFDAPFRVPIWINTSQTKSAIVGDYGVRLMGAENDGLKTTILIEPNVPELDS